MLSFQTQVAYLIPILDIFWLFFNERNYNLESNSLIDYNPIRDLYSKKNTKLNND